MKNEKEKEAEERKKKKEEELKRIEQLNNNKKEERSVPPRQKDEDHVKEEDSGAGEGLSLQEALNMEPIKFNHKGGGTKNAASKPENKKEPTHGKKSEDKKNNKVSDRGEQGTAKEDKGDVLEEGKDIYFS
jgi:hypothetical protein